MTTLLSIVGLVIGAYQILNVLADIIVTARRKKARERKAWLEETWPR